MRCMDRRLDAIQKAMEKEMQSVTIRDIMDDTSRLLGADS